MSITDTIDNIIKARWNPGESFNINDIYQIAETRGITNARPTIKRTMQEVRDLGTIQFHKGSERGTYTRLPCGLEKAGDTKSHAKQATEWMKNHFVNIVDKTSASGRILNRLNNRLDYDPIIEDIDLIYKDTDSNTERQSQISTRIGQGRFRKELIQYWGACSITGCKIVAILRASHIKPWRSATGTERLDMYNGLLLTPNADALFDAGFISVDENGQMLRSQILDHVNCDLKTLGIPNTCNLPIKDQHKRYLEYHRANIFLS